MNTDEITHDSSKPPPSRPQSKPDWAAEKAAEAKSLSKQALAIATEARDAGKQLVGMMGTSPDPVRKVVGSGLLGGIAEILTRLETIESVKTTTDTATAAVAQAKALGRAQWGTVGRTLATIVGLAGTAVALWKTLGGGH